MQRFTYTIAGCSPVNFSLLFVCFVVPWLALSHGVFTHCINLCSTGPKYFHGIVIMLPLFSIFFPVLEENARVCFVSLLCLSLVLLLCFMHL